MYKKRTLIPICHFDYFSSPSISFSFSYNPILVMESTKDHHMHALFLALMEKIAIKWKIFGASLE